MNDFLIFFPLGNLLLYKEKSRIQSVKCKEGDWMDMQEEELYDSGHSKALPELFWKILMLKVWQPILSQLHSERTDGRACLCTVYLESEPGISHCCRFLGLLSLLPTRGPPWTCNSCSWDMRMPSLAKLPLLLQSKWQARAAVGEETRIPSILGHCWFITSLHITKMLGD